MVNQQVPPRGSTEEELSEEVYHPTSSEQEKSELDTQEKNLVHRTRSASQLPPKKPGITDEEYYSQYRTDKLTEPKEHRRQTSVSTRAQRAVDKATELEEKGRELNKRENVARSEQLDFVVQQLGFDNPDSDEYQEYYQLFSEMDHKNFFSEFKTIPGAAKLLLKQLQRVPQISSASIPRVPKKVKASPPIPPSSGDDDPGSSGSSPVPDSPDSMHANRNNNIPDRSRSRTFDTSNKPDLSRKRKQMADVEKFAGEVHGTISFNQWKHQIYDKMEQDLSYYLTEESRMIYAKSRTGGIAWEAVHEVFSREALPEFKIYTLEDLMEVLNQQFGNKFEEEQAYDSFTSLKIGDATVFSEFKINFLSLARKAKIPTSIWKRLLIEKLTPNLYREVHLIIKNISFIETCDIIQQADDDNRGQLQRLYHNQKNKSTRNAYIPMKNKALPRVSSFGPSGSTSLVKYTPRLVNASSSIPASTTFPARQRLESGSQMLCYNCNKPGHYASSCPEPRKEGVKVVEEDGELVTQYAIDETDKDGEDKDESSGNEEA